MVKPIKPDTTFSSFAAAVEASAQGRFRAQGRLIQFSEANGAHAHFDRTWMLRVEVAERVAACAHAEMRRLGLSLPDLSPEASPFWYWLNAAEPVEGFDGSVYIALEAELADKRKVAFDTVLLISTAGTLEGQEVRVQSRDSPREEMRALLRSELRRAHNKIAALGLSEASIRRRDLPGWTVPVVEGARREAEAGRRYAEFVSALHGALGVTRLHGIKARG